MNNYDKRELNRLLAENKKLREALEELTLRCDGDEGVRADGSNIQTYQALADKKELVEALNAFVINEGRDAFVCLDKGIGTATEAGKRWIKARAILAKHKD